MLNRNRPTTSLQPAAPAHSSCSHCAQRRASSRWIFFCGNDPRWRILRMLPTSSPPRPTPASGRRCIEPAAPLSLEKLRDATGKLLQLPADPNRAASTVDATIERLAKHRSFGCVAASLAQETTTAAVKRGLSTVSARATAINETQASHTTA